MDSVKLLQKYLGCETELYHIVFTHSRSVADKALLLAQKHPELQLNLVFLEEAAMIHDIGVYRTKAPEILCFGTYPYICHGYLGSEIMVKEGFPQHALVCERHTGTGLSLSEIINKQIPLPHREMNPLSLEEKLICFVDKFFSKTHLKEEFPVSVVREKLKKYGSVGVKRFDDWCELFL